MGDSNFWELDACMLGQQEITTLTPSFSLNRMLQIPLARQV